jgi:ribosomal RNA-processing protein 9
MSSFFTLSASQKKRKRAEKEQNPTHKKRRGDERPTQRGAKSRVSQRDESISGSESEEGSAAPADLSENEVYTSESEHENETGAEKRLRLAERYLDNLREEIGEGEFDAADLDRDILAERLKEDVSESKGRLYRFITPTYNFVGAISTQFRMDSGCSTSVAVCAPYVYIATKDRRITKWEIPEHGVISGKTKRPLARRPKKLKSTKGSIHEVGNQAYKHHTASILCIAASQDGRFVATGGADKRLIIWSSEDLSPLRVFAQHRDSIIGLAFRRGTNQLYSGSADRTIKTWSLNELAYVETLFGHQDTVSDVAALSQERCLSAGARDRTVRLWKVVEETQLVFRGGGSSASKSRRKDQPTSSNPAAAEGSIERVAFIDDEIFVSGSDSGALSLWNINKKKPIYTVVAAHGFDPPPKPEEVFADIDVGDKKVPSPPEARWITALVVIPYSDLILSGSWDGHIRVWRISQDKKRLEAVGALGSGGVQSEIESITENIDGDIDRAKNSQLAARGVVNDLDVFERGKRGKEILYVVAALGREHRLGRWKKIIQGKNGAVVFEIRKHNTLDGAVETEASGGMR